VTKCSELHYSSSSYTSVHVFWTGESSALQTPLNKIKLAPTEFEFNFQCLLVGGHGNLLELLYSLNQRTRLSSADFGKLVRRVQAENTSTSRFWTPPPEAKLNRGQKASAPIPTPRGRRRDPSSMEVFTNNLVSSVLDEVTGKSASSTAQAHSPATKLASSDMGEPEKNVAEKGKKPSSSDSKSRGKDDNRGDCSNTPVFLLESLMLKLSTLQYMSGKTLLLLMSSRHSEQLFESELQSNSLTKLVRECAAKIFADGAPNPPIKRNIKQSEIERTFAVLRSNPDLRAILHGDAEEQEPAAVVTEGQRGRWKFIDFEDRENLRSSRRRGIRKTGSASGLLPPTTTIRVTGATRQQSETSGLAAAAAATIVVPPIHGPLGQMGFSEEHITMAIIALRVRHDDLSATTINQCATWMIDHPVPSAVRNAEHLTARRNAPRQFTHPRLLRENAATNDKAIVVWTKNCWLA
jgi:hypothetical protein